MKKKLHFVGLVGSMLMMLSLLGTPVRATSPNLGRIAISSPFICSITVLFPNAPKSNATDTCGHGTAQDGTAAPTGSYAVGDEVWAVSGPGQLTAYNIAYEEVGGIAAGFANGHFVVNASATCVSGPCEGSQLEPVTIHGTFEWVRVGLTAVITIPAQKDPPGGNVALHIHDPVLSSHVGHKDKAGAKVSCAATDTPPAVGAAAFVPQEPPPTTPDDFTVTILGAVSGACARPEK